VCRLDEYPQLYAICDWLHDFSVRAHAGDGATESRFAVNRGRSISPGALPDTVDTIGIPSPVVLPSPFDKLRAGSSGLDVFLNATQDYRPGLAERAGLVPPGTAENLTGLAE
jgi:hypothetical protein